jgi:hypothetical protein
MDFIGINKHLRLAGLSLFFVLCSLFFVLPTSADTLVHGYNSTGSLQPGIVAALKDKNTVIPAPAKDSKKIYGVVISPNQVPFTVSNQGQQTFVATNGNYTVLVSAEYGTIKNGDYISISSTDGIAAKATPDKPVILGKALEKFDGKSGVITKIGNYGVGTILANINPTRNPIAKSDAAIPGPLRRVAETVSGGNAVSALRIYLSLAVVVAAAAISAVLVSAGVRSGIVSIGRNPLSKKSIYRGLAQAILMAILIFIIGLFGVYLLLRL